MLFVRNPTGVSHSPPEHAEDADCAGVVALADVLEEDDAVTTSGRTPGGRPVPTAEDVLIEVDGGRFTAVDAAPRQPGTGCPA